MPGGLIELTTYGSQDLYLTGDPEITFFKIVYRRHTHFSVESVRVNFDDTVGFDSASTLTIPKIGDLIHKMYLEIDIPEIQLKRCLQDGCGEDLKKKLDQAIIDYKIATKFMSINRRAYSESHEILEAKNSNSPKGVINKINKIFKDEEDVNIIKAFRSLLKTNSDNSCLFNYEDVCMKSIVDNLQNLNKKTGLEDMFKCMKIGINKSIKTQEYYFKRVRLMKDAYEDSINDNIKFAWVERLGHSIIEEVEIRIGGDKIDKHLGEWINVWYELTAHRDIEDIYFKMIVNVEELVSFDRITKPKYKLKVPMQFWFNRFNGLAFPLIAMDYHDITFHVKFRKFEQVAYVEDKTKIFVDDDSACDKLFLDEVSEVLGVDLDATLLIDYIYLDSDERKRFAQSAHEYLIEQLQVLEILDVDVQTQNIVLNNFCHPSKELVWVNQKKEYTENLSGFTKLRWDNYSMTDDNKGNPIKSAGMDFHGYTRVPKLDGNYFNYVQPYQHHYTTPSDGINMYSFALFPEEHQPSCTANFSRLSRVMLALELNEKFFDCNKGDRPRYNTRIYTRNTNILRIFSGFGSVAFHYG
jgi:hypothetical protein